MKKALRRSLSLLLAITLVFGSAYVGLAEVDFGSINITNPFAVKVNAASESDLIFNINDDGESYSVRAGNEELAGELVIPSVYNGLPVTEIGGNAFAFCDGLTSVVIPDSVLYIGSNAFSYCTGILFIDLGEGVTSIGSGAFNRCNSLTSLIIPDSVTSIGSDLFNNATALEEVKLSNNLTTISSDAFWNCDSLSSITIPSTVTSIGDDAFNSCNNLRSVYITDLAAWCSIRFDNHSSNPLYGGADLYVNDVLLTDITDDITSIGDYAFCGCTSFTSITIPDSVTSIGDSAFDNCTNLASAVIGNSVTSIGDRAFCGCINLASVSIGDNVVSIGEWGFYKCTSLTSITIPDSVTTIGDYAFYECTNIASVSIGDNVISIGAFAFGKCTSITSITISDSVTSIGDCAFAYCTNLASVLLGDSVTSIGDYAFSHCSSLTTITIPNSVTIIEEHAFSNCTSLNSITIPDRVTSIGSYAFSGCLGLASITIPNSVMSIDYYAFYKCTNLKSVYINNLTAWCSIGFGNYCSNPLFNGADLYVNNALLTDITDDVISIGDYAFYGYTRFTSITIPDSVTSIGDYAFSKCPNLVSVLVGDNVTSIGNSAFHDCTSLTSIALSDSVTNIGYSAFQACTNLESVTIGNSVASIGNSAFYDCTSLTTITIPDSVTSIGERAFANCTNLASVLIGDSVTSIGNNTFYNCTSLESITLPDSVKSIGSNAFTTNNPNFSIKINNEDSDVVIALIDNETQYTAKHTGINDADDRYLDRNKTSYYSTSSNLSLSNSLNLVVNYDFKDAVKKDVTVSAVRIKLPSSVDFLGAKINGNMVDNVPNSRGLLILNPTTISGKITLSVRVSGTSYLSSYAQIEYKLNGKTKTETIGIVNINDNLLTISAPSQTSSSSIEVKGLAVAGDEVKIFVDGIEQNTTIARNTGSYSSTVTLNNCKDGEEYLIEARVGDKTASTKVVYEDDAVSITSAKMIYRGNEYDLLKSEGKLPVISWAYNTSFSFVVKVDKPDKVHKVIVKSTKGSEQKFLTAYYDDELDAYVATGFKNYVPGIISVVVYDESDILQLEREVSKRIEIIENADYSKVEGKITSSQITDADNGLGQFSGILTNKDTGETILDLSYSRSRIPGLPDHVVNNPSVVVLENDDGSISYYDFFSGNGAVRVYTVVKSLGARGVGESSSDYYVDEVKDHFIEEIIKSFEDDLLSESFDVFKDLKDYFENFEKVVDVPVTLINSIDEFYTLSQKAWYSVENNSNLSEAEKQEKYSELRKADLVTALYVVAEFLGEVTVAFVNVCQPPIDVPIVSCLLSAVFDILEVDGLEATYKEGHETINLLYTTIAGEDLTAMQKYAIDPSGYVYEAVPSNRLEGVTATIYYSKYETGEGAVVWDAGEYDQVNPLITYEDGSYMWDVPEGYWQVKYEKDGYETAYSEWMYVPPERTDVNIALNSTLAPEIEYAVAYSDGVEIGFSQYMDVDSVNKSNININSVDFDVEPLDAEDNGNGTQFAKKFFLKSKSILSKTAKITVSGVKNYCGKQLASAYNKTFNVIDRVERLEVKESVYVDSGETTKVVVSALPAAAAKGRTATVKLSGNFDENDSFIARVTENITFDASGKAYIEVNTQLPGDVKVTVSLDNSNIESSFDLYVVSDITNIPHEHTPSDWKVNNENHTMYKECTECGEILETKNITVSATKLTSCYNEVKGVQLKWNAVNGAKSYKVYRKLPSQTEWVEIKSTTALEYQDTNVTGNTVYQYSVKAVDQYGNESDYSPQRECRFIETPTLLSRTNAVGGVTIKWKKVAGATSYRIYRRGAGVNYWYYLGDFPATLDTFTDLETANYFPDDASKNALAKPKSGNYYRYTVRASYDGEDSTGKDYLIYSGFDTNGLYLKYVATPKLTSISNATNGLQIKWNAVNGGGNVEYRVYRRGAGSTYWYYLGTTTNTTWTDSGVKIANGGYYRYTVRAVAGTNGKGWYSAFDTTGLYLMRLANPTLTSAVSSTSGITVKWSAIKGTTGYYVYRKTANSGWTRIAAVGGTNNTTFLDKTAKKGTTYTYTVRAVYGATTSAYNSGISCYDKY